MSASSVSRHLLGFAASAYVHGSSTQFGLIRLGVHHLRSESSCLQSPRGSLGIHHLRSGNYCFNLSRSCVLPCHNTDTSGGDESSVEVATRHDIETGIQWSSLSRDEFLAHLAHLRKLRPDFCPSMLCEEERMEFCRKRSSVMIKCGEEVSKMIGNLDLITPLLEYRQSKRGEAAPSSNRKRSSIISKCAQVVSKMISNLDLITPLLEYRKFQRGEKAPSSKNEKLDEKSRCNKPECGINLHI